MSDLIDRQILKADLLCGDNAEHDYCFPCKEILERIDNQPSAETHDKRTEMHACDWVSRKVAIDAVIKRDANCGIDSAEVLKTLPSVQSAEAIPVAFLEEQAKWLESIDNAFAKIEANNIRVIIKRWRNGKDERSD